MKDLQFRLTAGKNIPDTTRRLTLRDSGIMETWIDSDRKGITAYLVYHKGRLIAWGAFDRLEPRYFFLDRNTTEISVFVSAKYRKLGIGMKLLRKLLRLIARRHPRAKVRYGALDAHGFFNTIYDKEIRRQGLRPVRWFT